MYHFFKQMKHFLYLPLRRLSNTFIFKQIQKHSKTLRYFSQNEPSFKLKRLSVFFLISQSLH